MIGAPFLRGCPCGSAEHYDACCGRLHRGAALAATPEELMRSRFSAYAVGDLDYVWATWHPRTRPAREELAAAPGQEWTGLTVHSAGLAEERSGWVEFTAVYSVGGRTGTLHERSRFEVRAGRWFYVDGDVTG